MCKGEAKDSSPSTPFIPMKKSHIFSWHLCLQLLYLPFFFSTVSSSSASRFNKIPRLSPIGRRETFLRDPETLSRPDSLSEDYKKFFYNQTLDHFNYKPESYSIFQQKYIVNSKYWGGSNAPIFAYFGAEGPLDDDLPVIGFLSDNAPRFKALLVYIENSSITFKGETTHGQVYYGESIPFGSREEALKNASTLGFFSSAQAIEDYAEVLLHVKKQFHAEESPVIVVGGSYGGMLASWFRLKYPHIALAALASSAPILYFDNITSQDGYFSIVTKDFREASESCYKTIQKSWSEIDKVAASPNGLLILSEKFNTCRPLKDSSELKDYLENFYAGAAQYNGPPDYPVNLVCGGIDGAKHGDDDILGKIFAGVKSSYETKRPCYVNQPQNLSETDVGWSWQTCSEMVMPIGISKNAMFPTSPFVLKDFIKDCKAIYSVPPRPHWVTTYYGGKNIKRVLHRFASNIIFSNGLRDPYSSGGVLENISKSVLAITTTNGSHCLDILQAKKTDPDWLVRQRKIEVTIIKRWLHQYYVDLKEFNKGKRAL